MTFMLFASAAIVVAIVMLVQGIRDREIGWGIAKFFLSLIVGGALTTLAVVLVSLIPGTEKTTTVESSETLVALGNDTEVSGSFFLGSGYIDGEPVYNYIVKDDAGGLHLESVNTEYATLYEDATPETAKIDKTINHYWAWWVAPFPIDGSRYWYSIHVPPGSVDTSFSVDVNG